MIRPLRPLALALAAAPALIASCGGPGASSGVLAFRHATLIPLTDVDSIPGQTVVVRGSRIETVGPDGEVDVPDGAREIDATGRYLIPGRFEMHGHTSKTRGSALGLYVAHGVTTLRDQGSEHAEVLRWRNEIRTGQRVGPRMIIAGPYLEARRNIERMRRDPPESRVEPFERARIPIGTPAEARRVVDSLAGLELDHLKIRTVENRETYLALNAAADARGLRVTGHAPGRPDLVLEAGQDGVDHGFYVPLDTVARERRMAWWRELAARDIGVVPTLIVLESGLAGRKAFQALVDDTTAAVHPLRPYVSRFMLLDWREQVREATEERATGLERVLSIVLRQLREMREAGVRVMAGSDVAVVGIFPGASLHDELRLFVDSLGMTPLEALRSASRSPAEWLGLADSVGTIEPGKVADLVLLEASPLASVRNTKRIAGVMLRGAWYDRAGLDRLLAEIRTMPDLRENDWRR